jgi:hypothetical protein
MTIPKSEVPRSRHPHKTRIPMNASFEETSIWVQLISLVAGLGVYFVVAGSMLYDGANVLIAYMPLFAVAVVFVVAVNVAGHAALAIASRPDGPDERDRLIAWRAESNSSWILGAGVIITIGCMIAPIGEVWVAHLLLLSLFFAEAAKDVLKLVYYRRGV